MLIDFDKIFLSALLFAWIIDVYMAIAIKQMPKNAINHYYLEFQRSKNLAFILSLKFLILSFILYYFYTSVFRNRAILGILIYILIVFDALLQFFRIKKKNYAEIKGQYNDDTKPFKLTAVLQGLRRMKDNYINIKSFSSIVEAEILNGKLNAYGIESFIQKDDCGGTDPVMQLTSGVHIMVKKDAYEEALAILNENGSREKEKKIMPSKSMMPFWILMFLSVGTGLFLSGHVYYPNLVKYGIIIVAIGVILWFGDRTKRKKENTT